MTPLVDKAGAFAAHAHEGQTRKGPGAIPYITHPVEVARSLMDVGVTDEVVIAAALLHDVIEDCGVSYETLREEFGPDVADVVREVTDDPALSKTKQKKAQVEKAPHLSHRAKLVKLADKLSNVRSLTTHPPGWKPESVRGYVTNARAVVEALGNVQPTLQAEFDDAARAALGESTPNRNENVFHRNARRGAPSEIANALPEIVRVAQQTYDDWRQNEDGFDEELGEGGICHLIADEICGVLASRGIDCGPVSAQIGEQHVWVVAKLEGDDAGVWSIDIPPDVYESGGGYSWRKKPNVTFGTEDVVVSHESPDPSDFERYMED